MIDSYFINKLFQNNCFKSTNSYFKKNSTEIINSSFRIHPVLLYLIFLFLRIKVVFWHFQVKYEKKSIAILSKHMLLVSGVETDNGSFMFPRSDKNMYQHSLFIKRGNDFNSCHSLIILKLNIAFWLFI